MRLEFHQLDRRWEHLRARHPSRQRRLLASLAASGQQTSIVVVAVEGHPDRYLVIDGYQRIAALQQLGRDTVEAVVWPVTEPEALMLDGCTRWAERQTALEQGWLLAEMEQRFGHGLEELARRFYQSVSWVSRRLALVEQLPESGNQQVREGKISAHVAMRFLAPVARVSLADCEHMAVAFAQHHCDTREAGRLYDAWRGGSRIVRERLLAEPELVFKKQRRAPPPEDGAAASVKRDLESAAAILRRARRRLQEALPQMSRAQQESSQREAETARRELDWMVEQIEKETLTAYADASATDGHSGTEHRGGEQARDCACPGAIPDQRAQSPAVEDERGSGDRAGREGRALPAAHPRPVKRLQGESRASP